MALEDKLFWLQLFLTLMYFVYEKQLWIAKLFEIPLKFKKNGLIWWNMQKLIFYFAHITESQKTKAYTTKLVLRFKKKSFIDFCKNIKWNVKSKILEE